MGTKIAWDKEWDKSKKPSKHCLQCLAQLRGLRRWHGIKNGINQRKKAIESLTKMA